MVVTDHRGFFAYIPQRSDELLYPQMSKTCERCTTLQAEIESARVETDAIQEDHAARVKFAPSGSAPLIAWLEEARKRWYDAAAEFEIHRAGHFVK